MSSTPNSPPPSDDDLKERVAELEDKWLRAVAELENVRKRAARDAERARERAVGQVAAQWLPVVDNLELALEHAEGDPEALVQGVRAVRDHAVGVLERLGFRRQDEVGVHFDPVRHEAVTAVADAGHEPGTVLSVLRPGYGEGEHQLRPASVVVSTKAD
ncbi:nucleotide exchange factor GrpE [Streptosporangiaceae bacterium NEAU-GS5]|nr:nucleotide exchange factor GrpE [Streptosporangiaceae bacterium NEAU-GS5]